MKYDLDHRYHHLNLNGKQHLFSFADILTVNNFDINILHEESNTIWARERERDDGGEGPLEEALKGRKRAEAEDGGEGKE